MRHHALMYSTAALCEALAVSRSGYHAWCKRPVNSAKQQCHAAIAAYHAQHKARVGAPSIAAELQARSETVSARAVGRIMRGLGLRAKSSVKFKRTTDSNHKYGASPNLLARQFKVGRPNQVWVGDITYIRTDEGWLYLAVMLDMHSRQVVGWQMSNRIDRHLVRDALQAALVSRGNPQGLMVHSDQGVQYAANDYRELITKHHLIQSMPQREAIHYAASRMWGGHSRRGNCWE